MANSNEYMRDYMKEYVAKRKARVHELLGGKCFLCGSIENLEVDHINPDEKSFTLARRWHRKWSDIEAELPKCQLLCQNCHKIKTKENGDLLRGGAGKNKILNPQHGTCVMYTREKCRCEPCRDWKRKARNRRP